MKDDKTSLLGQKFSRRSALTLAGAFGAGMALGTGGALSARELAEADQTVEFYGKHQAGIATPQQDRLHFASFDLTVSKASEVRDLMRAWSEAAAKMCAGQPVGGENDDAFVPPDDTGEAHDLTRPGISRSPSGSGRRSSSGTGRTVSGSRLAGPRRFSPYRTFPATTSTPASRAATCASRPAQTTRR